MVYARNLASAISKRNRAEEHRESLKRRIDTEGLANTDLVPVRTKFDPESGTHIAYTKSLPNRLIAHSSVLIGDCVQNLRACLDHLMWQLALEMSNGRTPKDANGVQFPIEFCRERFFSARVLHQIDSRYHAILEGLQPYNGGHGERLTTLKKLTNDDKHRSLTALAVSTYAFKFDSIFIDGIDFNHAAPTLQVDTEAMRVTLSMALAQSDVEVDGEVTPQVTLEDGSDALNAMDMLIETVRFILDTVGTA